MENIEVYNIQGTWCLIKDNKVYSIKDGLFKQIILDPEFVRNYDLILKLNVFQTLYPKAEA